VFTLQPLHHSAIDVRFFFALGFANTSALISSRRFREIGFGTIALCTYKVTSASFTPTVAALMRCIFTTT